MKHESVFVQRMKFNFEPHIQRRGDDYYDREVYYCIFKGDDEVVLLVTGERTYKIRFSKVPGQEYDPEISCSCPYFKEAYCKHAWVGVRYIDEHVPDFFTTRNNRPFRPNKSIKNIQPEEKGLKNLKELVKAQRAYSIEESADPEHRLAQRKRQVFYVIEQSQFGYDSDGPVKINLCQKELLKSGKWGSLKELKLPGYNWKAYVSLEDQVILKKLFSLGALEEQASYWTGERNLVGTLIPHAYFEEVFRALILTKRLLIDKDEGLTEVKAFIKAVLKFQVSERNNTYSLKPVFYNQETEEVFKINSNLRVFNLSLHITSKSNLVSIGNYNLISLAESIYRNPIKTSKVNREELQDYLFQIFSSNDLLLPEGWDQSLRESHVSPRLLIEDNSSEDEGEASVFAQMEFLYTDQKGNKIHDLFLDVEKENIWLDKIETFDSWSWLSREDKIGYFKAENLSEVFLGLVEAGWEILIDKKRLKPAQDSNFKIVSSGTDWFDLQSEVSFGDEVFDVEALLETIRNNNKFILLKSGDSGMLPKELVKKLKAIASFLQKKDNSHGFHASQAFFLPEFIKEETDASFKTKIKDYQKIKKLKKEKNPVSFSGNLHDYQKEGLSWLKNLHDSDFSGCLADDMGLGKTVQVLAFLQHLKNKNKRLKKASKPHLIVVPKSLLHNWQDEAAKFTKNIKILEYSTKDRTDYIDQFNSYDVVILTYGVLLRDVHKLEDFEFSYVILDEAQAIKNRSAKIYRAVRMLKSEKRLAITGTPVENHVDDLINIFDFLNPGMVGRKLRDAVNGKSLSSIEGASIELLQKGLSPLILRRKKEDVLSDLPDKVETYLYSDFSKKQKSLYESLKLHYRESLKKNVDENGFKKSKMHVLEALLRLRQVSCHPALIEGQKGTSDKVDVLVEKVSELCAQGKSVLVFSQFVKLLEIVKTELNKNKVPFYYLDGKTNNRKQIVSEFQEQTEGAAFLISLKAGGVGLNLTNASYCFLLDPWWNPAVEAQAVDRTHRIGQTNTVFTYRMVTKNSVEEKILELQKQKKNVSSALIDGSAGGLKSFTWSDVQDLLE